MFELLKKKLSNWRNSLNKESKEEKESSKRESDIKETLQEVSEEIIQKTPASQDEIIDTTYAKKELKEEFLEKKKIHRQEISESKKSIFSRAKEKITSVVIEENEFERQFDELEESLIESNVALEAIDKIKKDLKERLVNKKILKKELDFIVKDSLKDSIYEILGDSFDLTEKARKSRKPFVILFFGINGVGKTTTIAKVSKFLQDKNLSCVIAASDTFRAASIEQLDFHAKKLKVKIIKHDYGSDPASVGFDAINYAKSHDTEIVLIDTAGRMHTASNLLKEMEKISRVCKPDLKIFVAESTTGNDAVNQAKQFNESIGIDGIILTKADVDEKGGTIISISYITKKPILFLGTGQKYEDFELFDKEKFMGRLGL